MITAVFDTNVILQGILSATGPAGTCIDLLSDDGFRLIASEATISEIQSVVTRPKLVRKNRQLRGSQPQLVLNKIREKAVMVGPPAQIYRFTRDRSDEVFLNLALENSADYLVTRDLDLLDLMENAEFVTLFPELSIVTPVGFLEAVRAT